MPEQSAHDRGDGRGRGGGRPVDPGLYGKTALLYEGGEEAHPEFCRDGGDKHHSADVPQRAVQERQKRIRRHTPHFCQHVPKRRACRSSFLPLCPRTFQLCTGHQRTKRIDQRTERTGNGGDYIRCQTYAGVLS